MYYAGRDRQIHKSVRAFDVRTCVCVFMRVHACICLEQSLQTRFCAL